MREIRLPKPTGEYAVGTFTYTVRNDRKEVMHQGGMRSVAARVYLRHTEPVYKALFRDMKHIGFSDAKHMIPLKSMVGKLSPDVAHDEICKVHLEFFDTYLKKMKNRPSFVDNDEVTFTEYAPLV